MYREFGLVKKTRFGEDTLSFDFKAGDGYADGFEYDAGQYLTIKATDGETTLRRHYSVTSNPGDPLLQCTTPLARERTAPPTGPCLPSCIPRSLPWGPRWSCRRRSATTAPGAGPEAERARRLRHGQDRGHPRHRGLRRGARRREGRDAGYGQGVVDRIDANIVAGGCDVKVKTMFGERDRGKVAERIAKFSSPHRDYDFICCGPKPFMK